MAELCAPEGLALGADGSLYFADSGNHHIRRITPGGTISSVAGGTCPYQQVCQSGYAGDGGPASQALLNNPEDVKFGPDGSLYVLDGFNEAVRRIGTNGIITTVAGGRGQGYSGDGGPATAAAIQFAGWSNGLAVGKDGTLDFSDSANNVVRRVGVDGIITTIAGQKAITSDFLDKGPALQHCLWDPSDVKILPDGGLLVASAGHILKMSGAYPGLAAGNPVIPSDDGSQVYLFDTSGRHSQTLDATTGALRYQFGYDGSGMLGTITDGNGNVTTIERTGSGQATAIVAPDGQRTTLTIDGDGYLASIANPAGDATQLVYSDDGLLTSLTDPRGNTKTITYDDFGRLAKDQDANGGYKALARTETPTSLAVMLSTAEGRSTTYTITQLPDGTESRTVSDASCGCAASESIRAGDGSTTTTSRDGTVSYTQQAPDPRFGMLAPVVGTATVTTPSGLRSSTSGARTVQLANPSDPMTLQTQTDTITVNGHTTTSVYTASTKTVTTTSPAGRTSTTTLDAEGRVAQEQAGGLTPVVYGYDARGRLSTVTQGTRTSQLSYDDDGNLASITDPANRTTAFSYDLAGRVTQQTLPDGRQISFTYDPNGNVTSITPPGRPAHAFAYTPVDLQDSYTPPDIGIGQVATTYGYNLDKQLTTITRPDGQQVGFGYDPATGRLATITAPLGQTAFAYDPVKGQLSSITTPDNQQLGYTYDGFLETGVSWSGTVSGSVGRTYTPDFRVSQSTVNGGNAVSYTYDNDGLLTGAGGLTITRDPTNGLISGTSLGSVTDTRSYNSFGELTGTTASISASPTYSVTYTRDTLGRISEKVETIQGATTTYDYSYDTAGRLTQVLTTPQGQGTLTTTYAYDANGNRLTKTDPSGTTSGTYDDQDRLTAYGTTSYTYNANGDLTGKTQNGASVSYTYDVFGNLRHVTLDSGVNIDYVIDARNRRIGKKVDGTLVQGFLYDDQLRPAAELDGSGNVVSRFVYGTHVNVPELIVKGSATYRILTDHLGSPRLVINTADGSDRPADGLRRVCERHPGHQPGLSAVRVRWWDLRHPDEAGEVRSEGLRRAGGEVDEQGSNSVLGRRSGSLCVRR